MKFLYKVYILRLIAMHRQCKIFLHMHPIKSYYSVTLIDLFLKYLNKYLCVVISLDERVKKYYTISVHMLNPYLKDAILKKINYTNGLFI
jgi:hypothetical protein